MANLKKKKVYFVSIIALTLFLQSLTSCSGSRRAEEKKPQVQRMGARRTPAVEENHPPSISAVSLTPKNPTVNDVLHLSFKCYDPDGDMCTTSVKWLVNDIPVTGAKGFSFSLKGAGKGDVVKAVITVSDGRGGTATAESEPVQVVNSPPRILSYSISPGNPSVDDVISVGVRATDPDGDEVYFTYRWFVNESEVDFADSSTFPARDAKPGDAVAVEVTPTDGDAYGKPVKIGPVKIVNRPPRFVGEPPPSVPTVGDTLVLKLRAVDPDGERVEYRLEGEVPENMEINPSTGELRWKVNPEVLKKGADITVIAVDPHEEKGRLKFHIGGQ